MNSNKSDSSQQSYGRFLIILITLSALLAVWLWWSNVFNSNQRIFYDMLEGSLKTTGVSKVVSQKEAAGSLNQISQAQYGSQNGVSVKTDIVQTVDGAETKVTTETLALKGESFVRYTDIVTPEKDGKKADFSAVINKWAKDDGSVGGENIFSESVYGAILFGNVPANKRQELMSMIKDQEIYKTNFSEAKTQQEDGRNVVVYKVEIQTKVYVELLKKYDEILGLELLGGIVPEDYAQAEPIKLELYVDKRSRNLTKLVYEDQAREEKYSGYGIQKRLEIPQDAVTRTELEESLQTILTTQ